MHDSTRCLREEHQVILKVLECFEIVLRQARHTGIVLRDAFEPFVEFFRDFADRCHHCKEEDRLFPCLERCGMPREHGPIAMMLHEHQLGRTHVRTIAAALPAASDGDSSAVQRVLEEGASFLDLLRHHIMKEDHILFPMADEMIAGPERIQLEGAYAQADGQEVNRAALSRCRTLADELCSRHGVALRQGPEQASG